MRRAVLILALPLLAACPRWGTEPEQQPVEHRGYYEAGFERDAFLPCGNDESWWVEGSGELYRRHRELAREYEPVMAVVTGRVSARGSHGHLGAYERVLRVESVLQVRAVSATDAVDCPRPQR